MLSAKPRGPYLPLRHVGAAREKWPVSTARTSEALPKSEDWVLGCPLRRVKPAEAWSEYISDLFERNLAVSEDGLDLLQPGETSWGPNGFVSDLSFELL